MQTLGHRIRRLRKWKGLSQTALESKSGIKREYLSKLENNELKNPTYNTMLKLCAGLGVSITSLVETGDELPPRRNPVIRVVSPQERQVSLKKGVNTNYFAVPIISKEVVAVNPLYLSEQEITDYALVPFNWLEVENAQNRYRCLRLGKDDQAMVPLLSPDSVVCFDIQQGDPQKLHQQMVVLRSREGNAVVRHIKLEDEYLVAVPENLKEYCLSIFPLEKGNPVIGKVVWFSKQVGGIVTKQ